MSPHYAQWTAGIVCNAKRGTALLGMITLLAGCESDHWVKMGESHGHMYQATLECANTSVPRLSSFANPIYTVNQRAAVDRCMTSKGYELVTKK